MNTNHSHTTYHGIRIFQTQYSVLGTSVAEALHEKFKEQTEGKFADLKLSERFFEEFADGDIKTNNATSVADCDCFIIAQMRNDKGLKYTDFIETCFLTDALLAGRASKVTVIFPQMPGARQDKRKAPRESIHFSTLIRMLRAAGVDRIVTLELHNPSTVGYDPHHFENVDVVNFMIKHIERNLKLDWTRTKFGAPDTNAANYVSRYAEHFGCDIVIINKQRSLKGESKHTHVIGDVKDYNVVLVDDMFDSVGTMNGGATALREKGALDLYAAGVHPILTRDWYENLKRANFKKILLTDSCILRPELFKLPEVTVIPVNKIIAGVIDNLHNGKSLTEYVKGDHQDWIPSTH